MSAVGGGGLVLAQRHDEEQRRRHQPQRQTLEELERRRVRPVDVVEHHQQRSPRGCLHQEVDRRRVEAESLLHVAWRLLLPVAGRLLGRAGEQDGDLGRERLARGLVERLDEAAHDLDPGPERGCGSALDARPPEQHDPLLCSPVRNLEGEPALADAGLPFDEREPPGTCENIRERLGQDTELAFPAGEGEPTRSSPGGGVRDAGREAPQRRELGLQPVGDELDQLERAFQVLEAVLTEAAQPHVLTLDQLRSRVREEDLAAVRSVRDPRRPVHGQAQELALHDRRLAGVQPHPDAQPRARRPPLHPERPLGLDRRAHRLARIVEDEEEGVALAVLLAAAVASEGLAQDVVVRGDRLAVRIRAELLQQACGALDVGEEVRPDDGVGLGGGLGAGGRSVPVELGVLPEDLRLELPQARARRDPELVPHQLPALAERGERLRLAAGAVERECKLAAEALAQRVSGNEPLEGGRDGRVAAEREECVDPVLGGREPQPLETARHRVRECLVGELAQRVAAPQLERLREGVQRCLVAPLRECRMTAVGQLLEPGGVELRPVGAQHVARRLRGDQRRLPRLAGRVEHAAQPRDVRLQLSRGRLGRRLAPERVDQPVRADHLPGVDEQPRQQRALTASAEIEARAVALDFERPEDAEAELSCHRENSRFGSEPEGWATGAVVARRRLGGRQERTHEGVAAAPDCEPDRCLHDAVRRALTAR